MSYVDFLARKERRAESAGIAVDPDALHPKLHDFQRDGTAWAVRTGRAALFWDCGLGKTFAQVEWARPIWYSIRETDTLNTAAAREDADERHICPLQLPLIERCVRLWSNRDELVFSPFAGIGSEGYVALQQHRRFLGIELKPSYWKTAVANLDAVSSQTKLDMGAAA